MGISISCLDIWRRNCPLSRGDPRKKKNIKTGTSAFKILEKGEDILGSFAVCGDGTRVYLLSTSIFIHFKFSIPLVYSTTNMGAVDFFQRIGSFSTSQYLILYFLNGKKYFCNRRVLLIKSTISTVWSKYFRVARRRHRASSLRNCLF